jgi:hypothetical protein
MLFGTESVPYTEVFGSVVKLVGSVKKMRNCVCTMMVYRVLKRLSLRIEI